jgi:hypothetical protein
MFGRATHRVAFFMAYAQQLRLPHRPHFLDFYQALLHFL